jgi:hypothetical protein
MGMFKKDRYAVDVLTLTKDPEVRPTLWKKGENQTFDNLWDWRLGQGDMFVGMQLKDSIAIYHPNDNPMANPMAKPSDANKYKPLGMEYFKNIEEEDENESDDAGTGLQSNTGTPHTKVNKKDITDLIELATLEPEALNKKIEKLKKESKNLKIQTQSKFQNAVNNTQSNASSPVQTPHLPTKSNRPIKQIPVQPIADNKEFQDRKDFARENKDNVKEIDDGNTSFHISDDEDNQKKKAVLLIDTDLESFKSLRKVKSLLKNYIQNKKKTARFKINEEFDDLRHDDDFQQVGDVDIRQINAKAVKPKGNDDPSGMTGIIDKLFGENTALQVGDKTQPVVSANQIEVIANIPNQKQAAQVSPQQAKVADKNEKETKDGKDKPETKDKNDKSDTKEPAKPEENPLEKNAVINLVKNVVTNKNNVLTKMKKKGKKKKKRNEEKSDQVASKEQVEEEKIIKYYQKKNYDYLKLDIKYMYEAIPQPVFNSILDILPHRVEDTKRRNLGKKTKSKEGDILPLKYSNVDLKKKAKNKGKKKNKSGKDSTQKSKQSELSAGSASSSQFMSLEDSFSETDGEDFDELSSTRRISEAKESRRRTLAENEKYIIIKPFPLTTSDRANEIIVNMNTDAKPNQKLNQVSSFTRKIRSQKAENPEDVETVADLVSKLHQEDQKEMEEFRKKDLHYDYKMLYNEIKVGDDKEKEIQKFNWSGNQIMSLNQFTLSQTEKAISSLNLQKLEVWMHGYSGFIRVTRRYCREFIESSFINFILLSSVFLNTLIMAMDGLSPDSWADTLSDINTGFTVIFTTEMAFKLYGLGPRKYVGDFFNIFDAFVVMISLVEVVINAMNSSDQSSGGKANNTASAFRAVRIFRIFRVLRVTRLLRSLHFMKVIIEVVKSTLEQFVYIAVLMFLFVFIFTLLGTQIFGGNFTFKKDYEYVRYNFDSFETAFYTSFILLTLENWNTILVSCLRSETTSVITIVYLIAWIFIGNYIFLNLFLAILLDGFENSENLQMVEEIEQEVKEHERIHRVLIKNYEEKKKNEVLEASKAIDKVMILIEPENYKDKKEISKKQACYQVLRDVDEDNDTLSDDLDIDAYLDKQFSTNQVIIDPFANVKCIKSLFYFTKYNPIRRFAATVVSHPKYSFSYLDSRQSSSFSSSPGPSSSSLRPISTLQSSDRLEKLSLTGLTESSRSSSR